MSRTVDDPGRLRFDWVAVPAGHARIGAAKLPAEPTRPAEMPATTVTLAAFSIARSPVTNERYADFTMATGHRPPAHWEGSRPPAGLERHPVTYVDRRDVGAFCAWAGVRLPTEAEWEKAARGVDGRPYPWGWERPGPRHANCAGRFGTTTEVGAFPAGASPYGTLDMAGNVLEWTASLDRPYPYRSDDGREDHEVDGRAVLRGGSFGQAAGDVRCAARHPLYGDACDEYIGFRVASDAEPSRQGVGFDWAAVPAGPFLMGTADGPGSEAMVDAGFRPMAGPEPSPGLGAPLHSVDLATFAIARTPVTNGQYVAYVDGTGARPPGHWVGRMPRHERLDHPVTYVDWHEARAFCDWAGVRLPTEVEWEMAAAGPDGRPFPWGVAQPDDSLAWFGHPADDVGTRGVGERPAGASPYGVLALAGDVWEWTSSLYRAYPYRPDDGREDPAAPGQRVLRGGSFRSPDAIYLRCAFRSRSYPTRRRDHIGFRVVQRGPADGP